MEKIANDELEECWLNGFHSSILVKDDFQFVLRSLSTLMFINIINGSLDGMRIVVIR